MELQCASHGRMPWHGTVVCSVEAGGCGRAWHLGDPDHPRHPPEDGCPCGADLNETARAICQVCFDAFTGDEN